MISKLKKIIKKIPLINLGAKILNDRLFLRYKNKAFLGSKKYWEQRYHRGGGTLVQVRMEDYQDLKLTLLIHL